MTEPMSADHPDTDAQPYVVELTVSEPADVGPLFRRLQPVRDAKVVRKRSGPAEGKLGVAETLQLLVPSSAVLAVAIRTLPVFIRSRRSSVTVTMKRGNRSATVTADNLADPQQVIEMADRLLSDD
ncbi:hypothetical protein [Streptomyces sp. NPDC019224]|uniref:effector-associated constant component EACC1 n=1 Tax=Streptomyces sp. NPDC019224 TaxID=3154484 RepID=UPI0033CAB5AF